MEIFPIIIEVFATVGGLCHRHRLDDAGAGACRWLYLHHNLHGGDGGGEGAAVRNFKVKALWLCNLLQLATWVGGLLHGEAQAVCSAGGDVAAVASRKLLDSCAVGVVPGAAGTGAAD